MQQCKQKQTTQQEPKRKGECGQHLWVATRTLWTQAWFGGCYLEIIEENSELVCSSTEFKKERIDRDSLGQFGDTIFLSRVIWHRQKYYPFAGTPKVSITSQKASRQKVAELGLELRSAWLQSAGYFHKVGPTSPPMIPSQILLISLSTSWVPKHLCLCSLCSPCWGFHPTPS